MVSYRRKEKNRCAIKTSPGSRVVQSVLGQELLFRQISASGRIVAQCDGMFKSFVSFTRASQPLQHVCGGGPVGLIAFHAFPWNFLKKPPSISWAPRLCESRGAADQRS